MSTFDFSGLSDADLNERYWAMSVSTPEDSALHEAIARELTSRKVSLKDPILMHDDSGKEA